MFSRNECNTGWTQFKQVNGVPITVKIPTHLKLYVYEKHYLELETTAGVQRVSKAELPVIRDFAHEMVYGEKVVMVDFKRPGAGAFNLEVDFTEDQYIQKIQHDITDTTLEQVNEFVGTSLPNFFKPVSDSGGADDISKKLKEVKSVAAVGMFELDAPDFEEQVTAFLQQHINCQSTSGSPVALNSFGE